jgi:acetyl esterase/lipase
MQRFLLLGLISLVIACQKEIRNNTNDTNNTIVQQSHEPEQSYIDVSYGTDARQKVDIFLPANRDTINTKLMVLIHGGGWGAGEKADMTAYMSGLIKLLPEYAFASIGYRLAGNGQNTFPAQENDINAAVTFLHNKKAEYKYSDKIVLLGASAGGHLALLQGYKYANIIAPRAIVSYFGPSDMAYLYDHAASSIIPPMLNYVIGYTPAQNPSIYASSSPINFVTSKSAPTILLQGELDSIIPVDQAYLLKDKLNAAGVINQVVVYPGEQHGFTETIMNDSYNKVISFLKANVP